MYFGEFVVPPTLIRKEKVVEPTNLSLGVFGKGFSQRKMLKVQLDYS